MLLNEDVGRALCDFEAELRGTRYCHRGTAELVSCVRLQASAAGRVAVAGHRLFNVHISSATSARATAVSSGALLAVTGSSNQGGQFQEQQDSGAPLRLIEHPSVPMLFVCEP